PRANELSQDVAGTLVRPQGFFLSTERRTERSKIEVGQAQVLLVAGIFRLPQDDSLLDGPGLLQPFLRQGHAAAPPVKVAEVVAKGRDGAVQARVVVDLQSQPLINGIRFLIGGQGGLGLAGGRVRSPSRTWVRARDFRRGTSAGCSRRSSW